MLTPAFVLDKCADLAPTDIGGAVIVWRWNFIQGSWALVRDRRYSSWEQITDHDWNIIATYAGSVTSNWMLSSVKE